MNFTFTPKDNRPPLEQFGRNLNKEALNKKGDPVIGRDNEIRRVIEIISRKTKNNPILIGEPGVGKTAVVEGLVQRIINKDVPSNLLDKEVYEINLSDVIAGAGVQGEFEERLHGILKQVHESNGKIILFIDEIHQLVGAGRTSGAMDAANILKPLMARGDIKLIGATTLNEYRNYVEKDGALERRMQKVYVKEPSKAEAYTILRGLKERWESFHGVQILDSALVAAVDLSDRYITDRFLPDKAIDLIDEAAAKIKTELHSQPKILETLNRDIINLKTEEAGLSKELDNPKSVKRLEIIKKEIENLKAKHQELSLKWMDEKKLYTELTATKEKIEETKNKIETFQAEAKFEQASKLLYAELPDQEKKLEDLKKQIKDSKLTIKDVVSEREVAAVLSESLKIPLDKILENNKQKLNNLKVILKSKIKAQDQAIELINNAILRNNVGINDPNKPIGSFLFLGPTGVGKTELARSVALGLFNNPKELVRIDMSEYMEKHSVSKLVGAPPGYVGYEQAGYLTETIRRKPYSVVLLDEIEKAHPDVLNLLLQILDYGTIKDGQGRTINFKNTVIIMTSNVGAKDILEGKLDQVDIAVKRTFKAEFLNRLDEIIIFNPLKEKELIKIAKKFIDELLDRLSYQDYEIRFEPNVFEQIIEQSYDPNYGARPIRRFIQNHIENLLANAILNDQLRPNEVAYVTWDKQKKSFAVLNEKQKIDLKN